MSTRAPFAVRSSRRVRRGEEGFTLVEALIAIIVLVTGLTAVANLMLISSTSNAVGNHMSATTTQASEVLDLIKALPWSELRQGGSLTADAGGTNPNDGTITDPGTRQLLFNTYRNVPGVGRIRTRWTITNVGGSANQAPARFITVTSESLSALAGGRATVTFTTVRTCTLGAPSAGPPAVCFPTN